MARIQRYGAAGETPAIPTGKTVARSGLAMVRKCTVGCASVAVKKFRVHGRAAWAREVASHLTLPRADVAALLAYGIDDRAHAWLMTRWQDWSNLRTLLRRCDDDGARERARLLAENLSSMLHRQGYEWIDAALRNILAPDLSISCYCIVDYMLRPCVDPEKFDMLRASLMDLSDMTHIQVGDAKPFISPFN